MGVAPETIECDMVIIVYDKPPDIGQGVNVGGVPHVVKATNKINDKRTEVCLMLQT